MRIIGIDPGMAIIGYCVLDVESGDGDDKFSIITTGSIQTSSKDDYATRLLEIYNDLNVLIQEYNPDIAVIEELFFFKNAKTIIPVAEARGVILMSFKMNNVRIFEYTPLVVKQTITGYGRADKQDVKEMIQLMFVDEVLPKLDDTTDAIAIAVCHARQYDCRVSS